MAQWWESAPAANPASAKQAPTQAPSPQESNQWWNSAAAETKPPASTAGVATDVAKSSGVGLGKGTIGLFGSIGDLGHAANYYLTYGAAKGAEKLGLLPQGKTASDFMASAEKLNQELEAQPARGIVPAAEKLFTPPRSAEIQRTIEQDVTGPFYKPQTTAGKYAETISELVPGAVTMPGQTLPNIAKFAVAPGVAMETAGQMSNQNPMMRLGAGLATTVGAALLGRPNIANRMLASDAAGVTPAQWNAAEALMRDAASRGLQITPAEAIQQVTNGATGLAKTQRIVESSTEGGRIMAPFMAERPQQVANAVDDTLSRVAPYREPTASAISGQRAAGNAIEDIRGQINAAEAPYYAAASTRTVPPRDLQLIAQDPAFQQAFRNVRSDPIRNKDIATYGANEVPTLIAVRKELARMESAAMNPGAGLTADAELARNITPIRDRLDQIITNTAPEYGQALGVGAGLREQMLDPARRGPLGQVAQADNLAGQTGALFPAKPFEGTASETSRAIQAMNAQDATAAPSLARQYLASQYAEAAQNLQSGANQYGGAKFAATVAGNPLQRQVLEANLGALPQGSSTLPDVRRLVAALEATGQRQQPGSLTAFNQEALSDFKRGGPMALVQALARPAARAQELAGRAQMGFHARRIAEALTSGPEGLEAIRRIARTGTGNQRALAQAVLGATPQLELGR